MLYLKREMFCVELQVNHLKVKNLELCWTSGELLVSAEPQKSDVLNFKLPFKCTEHQ